MIDIIRLVHAGQRRIPREIALLIAKHATDDIFTEREFDVLRVLPREVRTKLLPQTSLSPNAQSRIISKHPLEAQGLAMVFML